MNHNLKVLENDKFHYKWSRHHAAVLRISPGDTVKVQINEVTSGQISRNSRAEDLSSLDNSKLYPLTGPIYVEGAMPGDALSVRVMDAKAADWGWTCIEPGFGLLEEFNKPFLWLWKIGERYAEFKNGIRIPVKPFCGTMGVAPPEDGFFDAAVPGIHGGNLDTRHLIAGSRLILPIWVEGALFSVGDMHAAQGDGEVCITGIECPGEITMAFDITKDANIEGPQYYTVEERSEGGYFATTGISTDLMDACKQSVRRMIEHLKNRFDLTREEAYVLCSVAGDLRIHEIVDRPNWVVGFMIRQDVFPR